MSIPLAEVVARLQRPRVLVVGDVMLDRYTIGTVERVSPEAPVPVLTEAEQHDRPGGAASVAALLAALEAEVTLLGVVGDDTAGRDFRRRQDGAGFDSRCLLTDPDRPTTLKHRFIGRASDRHPQQLLRVDREVRSPLSARREADLLAILASCWDGYVAVLVSDYGKGVCTPTILHRCRELTQARHIPLLVDPRPGNDYTCYAGATCLTPNRNKASLAAGRAIDRPEAALAASEQLLGALEVQAVVVTLDRDGMALAHRDGRRQLFPHAAASGLRCDWGRRHGARRVGSGTGVRLRLRRSHPAG